MADPIDLDQVRMSAAHEDAIRRLGYQPSDGNPIGWLITNLAQAMRWVPATRELRAKRIRAIGLGDAIRAALGVSLDDDQLVEEIRRLRAENERHRRILLDVSEAVSGGAVPPDDLARTLVASYAGFMAADRKLRAEVATAREKGRAEERAAVVAWLRSESASHHAKSQEFTANNAPLCGTFSAESAAVLLRACSNIERGKHREEDDNG